MALLASRNITVGAYTRWVVDYSDWLQCGATLGVVAAVSSSTATVDTVSKNPENTQVIFYVSSATLNEVFTVTLTVSDTLSQVKIDTVEFTVVAP